MIKTSRFIIASYRCLLRELTSDQSFASSTLPPGTGLLAIEAARQAGPTGKVLGIDLSKGMLDEANRKAAMARLQNIDFMLADAERLELPRESFDCVLCASAVVLMPNIPRVFHHWSDFVKSGGTLAFDTPAKPFGISQMVADIAGGHGVHLAYANLADTPNKCRSLLEGAGFEVVAVRTELANSNLSSLAKQSRSGMSTSIILRGKLSRRRNRQPAMPYDPNT